MKLSEAELEQKVLRTALRTTKYGKLMLSLLRPEHFNYPPCVSGFNRVRTLIKKRDICPSWDEIVSDPIIDRGQRKLLKASRNSTFKSRDAVMGAYENLEKYRRMRSIAVMVEYGAKNIEKDSIDVDELTEELSNLLAKARKNASSKEEMIHIGKGNNSNKLVKKIIEGEAVTLISTGFKDPNGEDVYLPLGGLVLVAAPTGRGKTAFAFQMAKNFADQGIDTAFLELEMDHAALMIRRLADIADVPMQTLMNAKKKLKLKQKKRIARRHLNRVKRLKKMGARETFWVPEEGVSMTDALQTLKPYGHTVVVIDYVGLMDGMDGELQWQHMGAALRHAKIYANGGRLVIVCVQLSEEGGVRYSKQMAEHASNVLKFNRTAKEIEAGCMMVHDAKGRNLKDVTFYVEPDLEFMRFNNLDPKEIQSRLKSMGGGDDDGGNGRGGKKKSGIKADVDSDYYKDPDDGDEDDEQDSNRRRKRRT